MSVDSGEMSTFRCRICGALHDGPPLSYSAVAPAPYYDVPEEERDHRCFLSSDQCVIDNQFFFIVGNIFLPILNSQETLNWTVWVSLSPADFGRTAELWNKAGREHEPPYFGWLSTALPYYPSTLNLKTNVFTQLVGVRPVIELQPCDHPLAHEQSTGIPWERAEEFASLILHGELN